MTPQSNRRLLRIYIRIIAWSAALGASLFFMIFIIGYAFGLKAADAAFSVESLTMKSVVEACRK